MTPAEITAFVAMMRDLCEKATPGPWESSTVESVGGASIYGDMASPRPQNRRVVATGRWTNECDGDERIVRSISERECDDNTAFIAAARTALPKALDIIEGLSMTLQIRDLELAELRKIKAAAEAHGLRGCLAREGHTEHEPSGCPCCTANAILAGRGPK